MGDWFEAMHPSLQRGMVPFSFSLDSGQSTAMGPAWSVWARGDMHRFDSDFEDVNARSGVRREYGDRIRGMVFEWGIEPGNLASRGSGILLEASGRF